jgi:hypothetical protein
LSNYCVFVFTLSNHSCSLLYFCLVCNVSHWRQDIAFAAALVNVGNNYMRSMVWGHMPNWYVPIMIYVWTKYGRLHIVPGILIIWRSWSNHKNLDIVTNVNQGCCKSNILPSVTYIADKTKIKKTARMVRQWTYHIWSTHRSWWVHISLACVPKPLTSYSWSTDFLKFMSSFHDSVNVSNAIHSLFIIGSQINHWGYMSTMHV